jgi:predicted nucleic-acid-binding Zn-ribbon protein
MKHSKKCPECGGTEIWHSTVGAAGQGINLLPKTGRAIFDLPQFDAFVCGDCGFYQLFVGDKWLSEVTLKWELYQ